MMDVDAQRVSVCRMIGTGEAIVSSGILPEGIEKMLRERLVEMCNAFDMPTIAERAPKQKAAS